MKSLLRFICCIVFLGLLACVPHQVVLVKSPDLVQCKTICVQHLKSCSQRCTDNCSRCNFSATDKAASSYFKYTNVKQVEGGYINRRLKSYRDPLQCRKVSCSCTSDYLTCKQGCTGVVEKRLSSLPYCP